MYTANVARSGQSTVRVDMWDSDSDPALLPISFCGAFPALSITPAEIPIRFSFLNFPYSRSINVENNSDLDGYFYIVPQTVERVESISRANFTNDAFFMHNLRNLSLNETWLTCKLTLRWLCSLDIRGYLNGILDVVLPRLPESVSVKEDRHYGDHKSFGQTASYIKVRWLGWLENRLLISKIHIFF